MPEKESCIQDLFNEYGRPVLNVEEGMKLLLENIEQNFIPPQTEPSKFGVNFQSPSIPDDDATSKEPVNFPIFIVEADVPLEEAIPASDKIFYKNANILGLFVQKDNKIIGLLKREIILEQMNTGIPGGILRQAKYFVCPKNDYSKLIIFYDSQNPPVCPNHRIKLVEQTP